MLTLLVRTEVRVIAMKEYSTLPRVSALKPHYQLQFHVVIKTPGGGVLLCDGCNQYILSLADRAMKYPVYFKMIDGTIFSEG